MVKLFLATAFFCSFFNAYADSIGALASGNWENPGIWTSGTVPGSGDVAFIGSTAPAGSAATATVSLTASESVNSLYLGYEDSGGTGTLNLGSSNLTVGNVLYIGLGGGTGTITEGTGSFTAPTVGVYNNSLTLGTGDVVTNLTLNASTGTTTAAGNITGNVSVYGTTATTGPSTLNLGANLTLSGALDVRDNSTVNMNGNNISANSIFLGYFDGQPTTLNRGTTPGSLTADNLYVANQNFNLLASDSITNFTLTNGSTTLNNGVSVSGLSLTNATATTTAANNVTGNVSVYGTTATTGPSTLNLGANLTLSGALDVRDNSTVNMNGNNISANSIFLGYYDGQPTTLNRGTTPGSLTATNLYVANQNFNLLASDSIGNFTLNNGSTTLNTGVSISGLYLTNATGTTTAANNITGNVGVFGTTGTSGPSTLNLGANLTLSGSFDVRDNSTVNMNGNNISASSILLGYYDGQPTTLNRGTTPGSLTAANLYVANQNFNLLPSDSIGNFNMYNGNTTLNSGVSVSSLFLSNATGTTTAANNITGNVSVAGTTPTTGPSTLNLGANLSVSDNFNVQDNSIVNMNGHSISAGNTITLGYYDGQPTTLNRGGSTATLSAANIYVGNETLGLIAGDSTQSLNLYSAANVTTAATGNVTASALVAQASTLTLGADMNLSTTMDVRDGSTLNMNGYSLTAADLYIGYFDVLPAYLTDDGGLDVGSEYVGNGSDITMISGDTINDLLSITGNSTVVVDQTPGQVTGLTLNGNSLADLTIDPSSMDLIFSIQSDPNWIFRWEDPAGGGNWIDEIDSLIADGSINVTAPNGYSVVDQNGYTYVEGGVSSVTPTPEPAGEGLMGLGILGVALIMRRRISNTTIRH